MFWLASKSVALNSVALWRAGVPAPTSTLPDQPAAGDLPGSTVLNSLTCGRRGWMRAS